MTRPTYLTDPCWNDEEVVCLQNTAAAPDDVDLRRGKHVFDAIHTPPPMTLYRNVRGFTAQTEGGVPIQQSELLDLVDSSIGNEHMLFLAGATGAGKSHMVTWLHAQYVERHDPDRTIVLHVRREDLDLGTVVRRLAAKLSPFGFEVAALEKAAAEADGALRGSIDSRLVSALSDYAAEVARESREFMGKLLTPSQKHLRQMAGQDVPPDPVPPAHVDVVRVRSELSRVEAWSHMITTNVARDALSGENGLLHRMRNPDPAERVIEESLLEPLSRVPDEQFAKQVHLLRDELKDPAVRRWVVNTLLGPRAVDYALREVGTAAAGNQLRNALRDSLKTAEADGKRIVLFFEDWGVVAGVQGVLLEAITSMSGQHTAVIADTTDHLRGLADNVADRSIAVVEIGDFFGLHDGHGDFAHTLAARGLNAVRLGGAQLREVAGSGRVVNACAACPHRVDCHAAFGAVADGELGDIGLFPLTRGVIDRKLAAPSVPKTARAVLMQIVRPAIKDTTNDLRSRRYPTAQVVQALGADGHRLTSAHLDVLTAEGAATEESRHVLEIYRESRALRTLPEPLGTHFGMGAFSVDAPDDAESSDSEVCPRCGKAPCECPTPPVLKPVIVEDAARFGRGEALAHPTELRDLVYRVAVAGVGFGNGVGTQRATEGIHRAADLRLGDEPKPGTVANIERGEAAEVGDLVWAASTSPPGSWRLQDENHFRRARALTLLRRLTDAYDQRVRDDDTRRHATAVLVPYLAVFASLVDSCEVEPDPAGLIDLTLRSHGDVQALGLSRELREALEDVPAARGELLSRIGMVQGAGGDYFGIDYTLIEPVLQELLGNGIELPDPASLPKTLQAFGRNVKADVDRKSQQLHALREQIAQLEDPIPADELQDLASAVRSLKGAMSDGSFGTAQRTAANQLSSHIDAALARGEPPSPATPEGEVGLLSLREAVQTIEPIRETKKASQEVRNALQVAVESIRPIGADVEPALLRLNESIADLAQRTGAHWPRIDGTSLGTATQSPLQGDGPLEQVQALEQRVRQTVRGDQDLQEVNDALAMAEKLLLQLGRVGETHRKANLVGVDLEFLRSLPPPVDSPTLTHLNGRTVTRWEDEARTWLAESNARVRSAWDLLKEQVRPPEMGKLALQLDNLVASDLFEQAQDAFRNLPVDVPSNPTDALDVVRELTVRANAALAGTASASSQQALAIRLQASGGRMALRTLTPQELQELKDEGGEMGFWVVMDD